MASARIGSTDTSCMVVSHFELGKYTSEGWVLKEILDFERTEPVCKHYVVSSTTPSYGGNGGSENQRLESVMESVVVKEPRFLITKLNGDHERQQLATERDAAIKALTELKLSSEAAQKKAAEDFEVLEGATRNYKFLSESSERQLREAQQQLEEQGSKAQKMEADIAKIRTAIGERPMKEILAESKA